MKLHANVDVTGKSGWLFADLVFNCEKVIPMAFAQGLKHFFCTAEPKVFEVLARIFKEHIPHGKWTMF